MVNLPIQPRYILPPLCLMVLSALFALFSLNDSLEFNRQLIEQGQVWRLISSQYVHTNWAHLGLNCAGIILIWALHAEHTKPLVYGAHTIVLATWCGICIYYFCPDIEIYTGLSALLHGVIVWGAIKDITVGMKTGWLLFFGIWAKILFEQLEGPSAQVSELIASNVAIDAHLIGAIGGVLLAIPLIFKLIKKRQA
ncbi:rhombosortase [Pseudoalteromonas porphyrae]|uniref:Rhombosortase n=2 Tax=Pseudoalteromonas TaxID=53246 RepID=A0A0N0M160_9GAMM|nr:MULTISPECIES: rhombosortase [Pseudoalteromonas]KPH64851.1 rhombosortase [Pseudoalteromonas porphyrae]KPH94944.1 rhombosortase [Pseudoalteromonas porphyrae]NMR24198.1 rhombosortase [Pseudoalteromonas sp. NEC-BIFX-2020_015]